ncbi:MAG: hypothetical protein ACI9UU_002057, partial [Candidatus Azotimanducaceae bacterium]
KWFGKLVTPALLQSRLCYMTLKVPAQSKRTDV